MDDCINCIDLGMFMNSIVQDVTTVRRSALCGEACEEQEDRGHAVHDGRTYGVDGAVQKHILYQL